MSKIKEVFKIVGYLIVLMFSGISLLIISIIVLASNVLTVRR